MSEITSLGGGWSGNRGHREKVPVVDTVVHAILHTQVFRITGWPIIPGSGILWSGRVNTNHIAV